MRVELSSRPGIGVVVEDETDAIYFCDYCHHELEIGQLALESEGKYSTFVYYHPECLSMHNSERLAKIEQALRKSILEH